MDDAKKRRKSTRSGAVDSSSAVLDHQDSVGIEGIHVTARTILKQAFVIGAAMAAAGLVMTIFAAWVFDIQDLPFKGEIRYGSDGRQTFYAYYPAMRNFAIVDNPAVPGNESRFSQLGFIGSGLFFYMTLNTFNWMMELGFSSFGGMVLIPFMVLLVGGTIFYFKILPRSMQKMENVLTVGVGIALIHSVVLMAIFFLGCLVSPTFRSLFGRPYLFSGDILSTLQAGIPLLFLTSFTYGAITGGLLSLLVAIRSAFDLSPQKQEENVP